MECKQLLLQRAKGTCGSDSVLLIFSCCLIRRAVLCSRQVSLHHCLDMYLRRILLDVTTSLLWYGKKCSVGITKKVRIL